MTVQICTLQIRQGTAAQWAVANPVLLPGEYGLELDTLRIKIGDGVTAWNNLGTTPVALGPQAPGDPTTLVLPLVESSLNFSSDDPLSGGGWNSFVSGAGSFPGGPAYFSVLKSFGTVQLPSDIVPPSDGYRFEVLGWSSSRARYTYGGGMDLAFNGVQTASGDWPCAWTIYWTGDGGTGFDSEVVFLSQGDLPIMLLNSNANFIAYSMLPSGRGIVADSTGTNLTGFVSKDLGLEGEPDPSAALDSTSTDKGFRPPQLTTTQMNAIAAPAEGLFVYNVSLSRYRARRAGAWRPFSEPEFSGAKVYHSSPALVLSSGSEQLFFWDAAIYDTDNYWNAGLNPDRLTVPEAGWYLVGFALAVVPGFASVRIGGHLVVGGAFAEEVIDYRFSLTNTDMVTPSASTILHLAAGTILQLKVFQISGVTLDFFQGGAAQLISPALWIQRIGT